MPAPPTRPRPPDRSRWRRPTWPRHRRTKRVTADLVQIAAQQVVGRSVASCAPPLHGGDGTGRPGPGRGCAAAALTTLCRPGRVAQLVRAPPLQGGGRGFEPLRAHRGMARERRRSRLFWSPCGSGPRGTKPVVSTAAARARGCRRHPAQRRLGLCRARSARPGPARRRRPRRPTRRAHAAPRGAGQGLPRRGGDGGLAHQRVHARPRRHRGRNPDPEDHTAGRRPVGQGRVGS